MTPIFSYYGGKQRIASKILPHLESINHSVYVEPFAGGATLLFAKPQRYVSNSHHYREVLNDTSDLVANFYRTASLYPDDLIRLIDATLYSESNHKKAKDICKNKGDYDNLTLAWAFYINIQQGFANKLNSGWGYDKIGKNSAATWHNKKQGLKRKISRLDKVFISCVDALICIDKWDSTDTLFYCDPPYINANQAHYKGYTEADFQALCDKLDSIKGSYILSCYPSNIYPKTASECIEIDAIMSASINKEVDKKRTEVLYSCNRHPSKTQQLTLL